MSDDADAKLCPQPTRILCKLGSDASGLCRNSEDDCDSRHIEYGDVFPNGIDKQQFEKECKNDIVEYKQIIDNVENKTPNKLRLLSWSVWGTCCQDLNVDYQFQIELMAMRVDKIVQIIKEEAPDIIMLQDVSREFIGMLHASMTVQCLMSHYNGYGNISNCTTRHTGVYMLSRYKPTQIEQHKLIGNMGYTTSVMLAIFNKCIFVNCHLQSSYDIDTKCKNSPLWLYYTRCRKEQLNTIKDFTSAFMPRCLFLCGNFNIDLDGELNVWPELKALNEFGAIDCWRHFFSRNNGYTENTEINDIKLKDTQHKQFRYDGILLKNTENFNGAVIENIFLIGDNNYKYSDEQTVRLRNNINSPTYFPSNRFGICASFVTFTDML